MFSTQVNWNEPNATDNSGTIPSLSSNYKPPQRFSQGTHVITYTAVDQSGNSVTCTFAIKVIGKQSCCLMVVPRRCLSWEMLTSFIGFHVNSYQLYVTDSRFRRSTKDEQLRQSFWSKVQLFLYDWLSSKWLVNGHVCCTWQQTARILGQSFTQLSRSERINTI